MKIHYKIGNLLVTTSPEWTDVTKDVEEKDPPFSLAKDNGIGVLQFSVAEYRKGKLPEFTPQILHEMREEFAKAQNFSGDFDELIAQGELMVSGGSYHSDDNLVRVWYCSNGNDIVLATYVSDLSESYQEAKECDAIIRQLKFVKR